MSSHQNDYDGYFSEVDEETQKACDEIELKHSPVKAARPLTNSYSSFKPKTSVSGSNRPRPLNATAASSSSASWPQAEPRTPLKKRDAEPHTQASRSSAVRRAFDSLSFASPVQCITPKKLFHEVSASTSKKKTTRPVILVGDSDVEDTLEVESLLTDTETASSFGPSPLTPQDSLSSLGSDWERIESLPTVRGSDSSPRKYIKLSKEKVPPYTRSSAPSTNTKPLVVKDIFNPDMPSSSSSQRNNGWGTSVAQPFQLAPTPPDDDAVLKNFFASPLGQDLDPYIIAHDKEIVDLMDNNKISWGVQYEIARGVTQGNWSWADVKAKIPQLHGSNSETAWKVRSIILDRTKPPSTYGRSVWQELDREQDAILENKGRGLGPMGPEGSENDWYGGKIQQAAKLVGDKGKYRIRLEPMENKRSYRLARFLGSRRVLQVKIPRDLIFEENKQLKDFMRHKFMLCGRVFVPFFAKDHAVYLVETNDNYERRPADWAGDQFRRSFKDIVNWHNPLHLNADQPITKYATRFALAFSTSIPVLQFKPENISIEPDTTDTWPGPGKPPAEYIKTDGCGLINEAALKIIARILNYLGYPVAIQGRVFGAKGLWILHPTDKNPEPKIWIRPSQRKIVYQYPVDRSHLIFDLLSVSSSASSVSLSKQSIINLSENGVPDVTLIEIMKKALTEEVRPLMKWQGPMAMEVLWSVVNRLSSVSRTRLSRMTASMTRALGLGGQDWRGEEIDIERNEDVPPPENEGPADNTGRASSGVPLSLSEYIMESLQAGFHPKDSTLLKDKIRTLVEVTIKSIIDKFSIPLPESLSAFIIPDPLGVLKEGEVYYRSSVAIVDSETQDVFNVLTGNVLLGSQIQISSSPRLRYPKGRCLVRFRSMSSHMFFVKVMAVDRPELSRWADVLIVSAKGEKSFASMLSGGDYDGDKVFILFLSSLLEHFKNKPVKPIPPNFKDDNFQKYPERVKQFAERVSALAPKDAQEAFADILMFDIDDSKFGLYSNWQEYAIWKHGYDDPRSERLAYIFNALLDSSKTGDRLKPGIFEQDQKQFSKPIPEFQMSDVEKPYIFHTLQRAGRAAGDEFLCEYDKMEGATQVAGDKVLLQPYDLAANRAMELYGQSKNPGRLTLCEELKRIRDCVDKAHNAYQEVMTKLARESESASPKKKTTSKSRKIQRKTDPMAHVYELYNCQVEDVFFFQNVDEIKASYAYKRKHRFGFDVAFRELCTMKAKASIHGIAPTIRSFDEAKAITSTYVRAATRLSAPDA
ncbi:hypothetical protein H2248_001505 [Termitomyces sp. 'cryptogamus']|nr:hypothetical protein H2248_001505 [Termitomyces sp. 'cryptogamus']